ncbi:uncharacterized protein YfbU (UPF0304 family) [Sinorhizobium meliloti]
MARLNFTAEQRLMIALLCDLHKKPDEREFRPENIKLIMEAICGGHDWAIDWEMGAMFPESVDRDEDVRFVTDVLDMWEFIELRWSRLGEEDKQRVRDGVPYLTDPQFIGFDGNNEAEYLSIARMLVESMNRFSSFRGRSLNSHGPKVDRYRQMLTRWPDIRGTLHRGELTVEQMIELLSRD